jgi:hypothetical protein
VHGHRHGEAPGAPYIQLGIKHLHGLCAAENQTLAGWQAAGVLVYSMMMLCHMLCMALQ